MWGVGVRGLGVRGMAVRGMAVRGMGVMAVRGMAVRGMAVRGMAVVPHVVETPCAGCYSIFACVGNRHLPEKGLQICGSGLQAAVGCKYSISNQAFSAIIKSEIKRAPVERKTAGLCL